MSKADHISPEEILSVVLSPDDSERVREEVEHILYERYDSLEFQFDGPPFQWQLRPDADSFSNENLRAISQDCLPERWLSSEAMRCYRELCDALLQARRMLQLEERLEKAAALNRLGERKPVEQNVANDDGEKDFSLRESELIILTKLKECYPLPRPQKTIMHLAHIQTNVTVRKYLNLLIAKGLVEKIGERGGYKITLKGLRLFDLQK